MPDEKPRPAAHPDRDAGGTPDRNADPDLDRDAIASPDRNAGAAPDRLRALCLALPGVTERVSHGEPSWFAGRPGRPRQFVTLADHHHDDRLAFWAAAPDGAQDHWLALAGDRFFRPPYVGGRGWVGVYLDGKLGEDPDDAGWADVAEIVAQAHAVVTMSNGWVANQRRTTQRQCAGD